MIMSGKVDPRPYSTLVEEIEAPVIDSMTGILGVIAMNEKSAKMTSMRLNGYGDKRGVVVTIFQVRKLTYLGVAYAPPQAPPLVEFGNYFTHG